MIDRSEDALSQIERGLNFPHISTIERISVKLGVPLETFFDSIEGAKTTPKRAGLQARLTVLTNELDDAGLALATEIIESIGKQNSK